MKVVTSNSEQQFIEETVRKGLRLDGRGLRNGRSIDIAFSAEEGCCIVMQGNTRVLAQVSCDITVPRAARPAEGILHVNLELSPMADPDFKSGAMSDAAIEASRLLERCIRDSRCIDLESLCIVAGMKVWTIRVDVQALNNDGNLIECASIATISALAHFRRPHVSVIGTDVTVHSLEDHNPVPLTLHHMPVVINLAVFDKGEHVVVDPVELEERVAPGNIVIGVNAHQEICLLHFSGPLGLKKDTVLQCSDIAVKRAQTLTQIIRTSLDNEAYKKKTNQETGFTSLLKASTILGAKRPISQIDSSKFTIDQDEAVEEVNESDESGGEDTEQVVLENLAPSAVREEARKFLERPEVAIFEGGRSQWQLDEDESEEDEVSEHAEEAGCVVKKEKDTEEPLSISEESSEEEERVFLKSEHLDINRGTPTGRGWYSKDQFF